MAADNHLKYRPDIDGLRAIAVLAVMYFHFFPKRLRSGFIGVDVFFVISGFLISTIVFSNLERGEFSVLGFYNRRIRRIFPALLAILVALLAIGYFTFLADEYALAGKHVAGGAGFVSNFVLNSESGYFDAAAESKPLLHLWSLGIEEQFYIVWPLLLAFVRRRNFSFLPITIVIAGVSLGSNLYLLRTSSAAAFYLPLARFWELMVGGLLAYITLHRPAALERFRDERAVLGAVLLVVGLLVIDRNKAFPGWWALLPTLGTALLISAGPTALLNRRLLSFKPLVWIGLISYPLYLWHWLLLATYRILGFHLRAAAVSLIAAAFVLSVITYFFIEKPVRKSRRRLVPIALLIAMAVVGGAGWYVYRAGGLEGVGYRTPEKTAFAGYFENSLPAWKYFERERILEKYATRCDFYDLASYRAGKATSVPADGIASDCYVRDPKKLRSVFVWGDSHAQQFHHGLSEQLPADWQVLQIASSGCTPRLDAEDSDHDYCARSNWLALKSIAEIKPDVVIVGQNLPPSVDDLERLSRRLHELGAVRVIFAGPTPHWTRDLPKIILRDLWPAPPRRTHVGIDQSIVDSDRSLQSKFKPAGNDRYVSLIDYFCNADGCLVYLGDDVKTGVTSWDYGHLTPIASTTFAKDVLVPLILLR